MNSPESCTAVRVGQHNAHLMVGLINARSVSIDSRPITILVIDQEKGDVPLTIRHLQM